MGRRRVALAAGFACQYRAKMLFFIDVCRIERHDTRNSVYQREGMVIVSGGLGTHFVV